MIKLIQHPSPNHSERHGSVIDMIVIHSTVGDLKSSLDWLCSKKSKVSANYLIAKNGDVYVLVSESEAAWHSGYRKINERSIGIELENNNRGEPYPVSQISALVELCQILITTYGIFPKNIVGHAAIAPKRKTDPFNFPWNFFFENLQPKEAKMTEQKEDIQITNGGTSPLPLQPSQTIIDDYLGLRTKPGYKSTEFWATIALNLATLLATIQGAVSPKVAAVVGLFSTSLYVVARTLAKR